MTSRSNQEPARILHIDLETYSSVDLAGCGVYKYVESDDFEILLFGYAVNDEPVKVIKRPTWHDLAKAGVADLITDKNTIKVAHNAAFERTCLSKLAFTKRGVEVSHPLFLPPEQWQDTMIMALEHGYPASLAMLGHALGLPEDKQ